MDKTPLVKGGQGRTDEQVTDAAVYFLIGLFAVAVTVIVKALIR